MSVKLLEIKGEDWIKGYSAQAGLPLGGIFQNATVFNPQVRVVSQFRVVLAVRAVRAVRELEQARMVQWGLMGLQGFLV